MVVTGIRGPNLRKTCHQQGEDFGGLQTRPKRKTIEGWIDKAFNQLNVAKEQVKSGVGYFEAIQAAQQCVELSVKSILSLLDIHYSRSHEWAPDKKEFAAIAEQTLQRGLLERLANQYLESLFLLNFWAQFYITAK